MEQNRKRRLVELGKDALILLLTCSALWLAARTQLLGPLSGLLREDAAPAAPGQEQGAGRGAGAVPLAMAVNIPGDGALPAVPDLPGNGPARYGLQYDQAACQELFQQVAGPLVEAMSSLEAPQPISRSQWEQALSGQVGVYMDFQGEIPMSVLAGWLSGEGVRAEACVRRLALSVWEDQVALYYRDEETGEYFRCVSGMADPDALSDTLSAYSDNGAVFAFEAREEYGALDPDTLLPGQTPQTAVYTAANPVSGGEEALRALVQDLGFSLSSTNFYSTDEQVARNGDDSVRLSDRGVAEYTAGGEGDGLLPILDQGGTGALFDSVETCRQVAAALMAGRCGEAGLYLRSAVPAGSGWEIEFEYSLNGVPVRLEGGPAARFLVQGGRIEQFTMRLRSYAAAGGSEAVLPLRQAVAALTALEREGEELLLAYADDGADTLSAGWAARDNAAGEG